MIELLDIGDRVETGSYWLHSRFRGAIAFLCHGSNALASVVDETKSAGPVHVVVRGLDLSRTKSLEVASGRVVLDGSELPIERRSDSLVPPAALDPARLRRNLGVLRGTLIECGSARSIVFLLKERRDSTASAFEEALADQFRAGVGRLLAGDLQAAAAIRGLGFGLTPSGDDFLAGFLLGLYALEMAGAGCFTAQRRAIREMAVSGNPFSAALLNCAGEGRCIEPARALIHSLFEEPEAVVVRHVRRLAAVGASSGVDLATGLYFALSGAPAW